MTISLDGQIVVVTGGAKRLGRAIALECARAGADVAITYRHSRAEAAQTVRDLQNIAPNRRFSAHQLDVSSNSEIVDFVQIIREQFGGATALVNNAAIFERTSVSDASVSDASVSDASADAGLLGAWSEANFDVHVGANLKGPYLLSARFAELFVRGQGGHIVNLADIHAWRPLANYVPYCASKAGLLMLTQSMAKALAPRVRVNCVCPGTISLPADQNMGAKDGLIGRIPFGRTGTELEIAQTVVFLLGGPAFITGAILPVDGGESLR